MCNCCSSALCGTPTRKGVTLGSIGVMLILMGLLLPMAIKHAVDDRICDQLCVPKKDAEAWKWENWRTNYNESIHPAEYISFYLYNMTNPNEVASGAKPVLDQVGPYVYRFYRSKFNVHHDIAPGQIGYELESQMVFNQSMSGAGLSEADTFIAINIGCTAGIQLFWQTLGQPYYETSIGSGQCPTAPLGPLDSNVCLFAPHTVRQKLFSQTSFAAELANFIFFTEPTGRLDPNIQFFPVCNSSASCHYEATAQHNFGLGGRCVPETLNVPTTVQLCQAPGNTNNNTLWRSYTGRRNINELGKLAAYLGNETFRQYNKPFSIAGAGDQYNFHPWVTSDETLTVWEDLLIRPIDMVYSSDTSVLDITTLRFQPTASFFSGNDSTYSDLTYPAGLFNATTVGVVRYGVPSPAFVSRPYFVGVTDKSVTDAVICRNCPTNVDADSMNIFIDVEPITGAVLRGQKVAQVSLQIGQAGLYEQNCSMYNRMTNPYACVKPAYVPQFWYNYSAVLSPEIADHIVKPSLDQALLARGVMIGSMYTGYILGGLFIMFAIWILISNGCDSHDGFVSVETNDQNIYRPLSHGSLQTK